MTVKDLLKRLSEEDYDKVIILSDGIGWTNIGNIKINESNITIYEDRNLLDDFYKKDGELITAYESKNIISDTWLTDLFDAKEVVITSKSIPVKYIKGNNNLIDNSGKRKSFVQSIWS